MEVASFSESTALESFKNRAFRCKKILVVEDDKDMSTLLRVVLRDTIGEAEIHWATSFEDSVKHIIENSNLAQNIPYDLIIADIFLEGNGIGLDLFKLINRTYLKVPFLIISSLPYDQVLEALGEEKQDNLFFLPKPFHFLKCKEKIKNLIMNRN